MIYVFKFLKLFTSFGPLVVQKPPSTGRFSTSQYTKTTHYCIALTDVKLVPRVARGESAYSDHNVVLAL